MDQQRNCYWSSPHERATAYVEDSPGLRMGILGYGAIGRQCARVAKAMGMDIIAYTSRQRPTPESKRDDSYCVPGTGDPEGPPPLSLVPWLLKGSPKHLPRTRPRRFGDVSPTHILHRQHPLSRTILHPLREENLRNKRGKGQTHRPGSFDIRSGRRKDQRSGPRRHGA